MRLNEYETVQFVVKWMIESKAGNDLDVSDVYLIEKIVDACHSDLRKHCMSKGPMVQGDRNKAKKRFLCTICEAGTCELIVENYDKSPTFCPFDREFGEYKWEEIPEGAKNTDR